MNYTEKDIISIITDSLDKRYVFIHGYGWETGEEKTPYKFIEYDRVSAFLSTVLEMSVEEYLNLEDELTENATAYIQDFKNEKDFIKFYKSYNKGKALKEIRFSDITKDISDGMYIVSFY